MTVHDSDISTQRHQPACEQRQGRRRLGTRAGAVVAALAGLLLLSACGGGGDGGVSFDIGVVVAGQPVGGVVVQPGMSQSISISAGQSIELDASEPVEWTLLVGGSAVTGGTVYYQGVSITETALSSSRIALDTSAAYLLTVPVSITLIVDTAIKVMETETA